MIETQFHVDDGKIIARRVQDVEDIIENNKRLQNEPQSRKSDLRHLASIPNVLIERWINEEYARGNVGLRMFTAEFDQLVERKLRDPEWAFLRVDNPSNPFHVGWR